MFSRAMFNFFSGALLIIALIPDAASYNKYGRTCKDIGCRTDETCVMVEDPCTGYTDKCGRYPTCRRTSDVSCTSMVCGENEYCKSENGAPKCVRKSTGFALPAGLNQVSHRSTTRVPSPPPRSSSYGGRYNGYSGSRNTVGDGSIFNRLFGNDRHPRPTSSVRSTTQTSGNNYYNTHTHVDNYGNRIWTFSENEMRTRTIPKRQTSYPTATETHGSSDTPKNSDDQSYLARSSGYPSSSGYPGSSSYPNSGSSKVSDSSNQPRSGYPNSGSGYPSSGSGYPSSGSSGYPSSGSSGYPSSRSNGSPSHSSNSELSGYPSSQSGYPSSGSSGYPSSGSSNYPSRDSSGYPIGSANPSRNSGSSGYPDNSRNGEETIRRTGASAVNAGYPSNPRTPVYPEGNPSYHGNYPAQNTGYPYNNQRSPYPNQGYSNGYSQNYPQGGYYPQAGYYPEGRYQGQNYMTTTNRPGIRDQLTNFARNMAEKVLTQTILDRITGRHQ
ncbi:PREDICTED: putative GPI-anchored protein PB15E9.01c isoform X1 [Acromyrmex echinatior]|uniref:putative GPI-anchored protein PB15E9.01c isoform X1 n=1 Tax=Acromyrmex echinatior TaxID=103372 RepID=UPI000580F5E8|nr:PREDICTED: putative GPI-anchored protein PB15E9.01c isoform X1 [Acromyrmex echinatior]XP_011058119.1 PREDICTED: putative GPI-anchored protein PB15E9.01c isoform X1 [Acromyrmex echinatior]